MEKHSLILQEDLMKTAKYDHCMKCNSTNMHNIVVIEDGEPIKVFVECADCDSYVCMYVLRRYTSDESYEGLLRILKGQISSDRRGKANEISYFTESVKKQFEDAKKIAKGGKEKRRVEQIIQETDIQE
jgi:hypothetical protein